MAFSVQMPALGESVTEGTVTRWLKQEGDTVELDEPLVEVSTDKVDTEIPSPAAGVLTKIIAQEDDTVEVGGELAVIGDAKDAGEAAAPAPEKVPAAQPESKPAPEPPPVQPTSGAPAGGDAKPVLMPELGESVTEGTVIRWLKKIGDSVQVDEPLVEVSTDKVDTEIPSPVAGVLVSISADEDATVPVGGELARIGVAADIGAAPAPKPAPKPVPEPAPTPKAEPAPLPPAAQPAGAAEGAPYVTPLVRKLASENNIDLAGVTGTGVVVASANRMCWPRLSKRSGRKHRRRPPRPPPRRPRKRRLPLRRRWHIYGAPPRRPAGFVRSPPTRPANLCRQRHS